MPKNDSDSTYTKVTGYGPETKQRTSPASPKKSWGVGSYYTDGRACSAFSQPGGYAQVPDAGRHTTGSPGRSSKPGRW
jgi:hypothetical protein